MLKNRRRDGSHACKSGPQDVEWGIEGTENESLRGPPCVCVARISWFGGEKNGRPELNGGGDPGKSGVPAHEPEGREGVAKMKKRDVCFCVKAGRMDFTV